MDIFTKQRRINSRILAASLIFFLLAAALLGYALNALFFTKPAKLTDMKSNDRVFTSLIDLAGPYVVNEDNGRAYYYAMTEEEMVFILEVGRETRQTYDALLASPDALKEALPLRIEGWVKSSSDEISNFMMEKYEMLLPNRPVPATDDPIRTRMFTTAEASPLYLPILVVSAIILFVALLIFLTRIVVRTRIAKIRRRVSEIYAGYDDFRFLEERKSLTIPELRLFISGHLLFTETGGLNMVDLSETSWMYSRLTGSGSNKMHYLHALPKSKTNKRTVLSLRSGRKNADQINLLWQYIQEKYPKILIGDTKDNKTLYKQRTAD